MRALALEGDFTLISKCHPKIMPFAQEAENLVQAVDLKGKV
jgi:hypothetical protein